MSILTGMIALVCVIMLMAVCLHDFVIDWRESGEDIRDLEALENLADTMEEYEIRRGLEIGEQN